MNSEKEKAIEAAWQKFYDEAMARWDAGNGMHPDSGSFVAGYTAAEKDRAWVPVGERLSESGLTVLCQTREARIVVNSWEAGCDQNEQWFRERFVAWMPLPSPYAPTNGGTDDEV